MANQYSCRENKRCNKCGIIKPSYSKKVVERYGVKVEHHFCLEHTLPAFAALEPDPEPAFVALEVAVVKPRAKIARAKCKTSFLTVSDMYRQGVTPGFMILEVFDGTPTVRGVANRRIEKRWGGQLTSLLFSESLTALVCKGLIQRSAGKDERKALYTRVGAALVLPPEPPRVKPEYIRPASLSLTSLRVKGMSFQDAILEALTATPTLRLMINASIGRRYGSCIASTNLTNALNALVKAGKIQRIGDEAGDKDRHASYCLAPVEKMGTIGQPFDNYNHARRTHPAPQSFAHSVEPNAATARH